MSTMNDRNVSPRRKGWLAIGLLVIVGMLAALALNLKRGFDGELSNAATTSRNMALSAAQHAASHIQKADWVLNRLVDEFSPEGGGKWFSAQKSGSPLPKLRLTQPEIKSLHIVRADGQVFYTLMDGNASVSALFLGDEAFFVAHRDNPNLGLTLSGSSAEQAQSGGNLILSRRLDNPDGSFAGVAAASVSLSPLGGFYVAFNPGKNASLTLLNDRLAVLARFPAGEVYRGKSLAGGPLAALLRNHSRSATYSGASPLDGVERISSFQRVGDFPLYIDAGLARRDVLATWRRNALIDGVVTFLLSAAVLFLSIGAMRRSGGGRGKEENPLPLVGEGETVAHQEVRHEPHPQPLEIPAIIASADETLVRQNETLQQRLAEAQAKIESSRAAHLASIALLRKRADESLNQFRKAAEQRLVEEVARSAGQERESMRRTRLVVMSEVIGNVAHLWRQPLNKLDLLLADIKVAQKFHELDPRLLMQSTLEGRQIIRDLFCTIDEFRNFFMPDKQRVAFNLEDALRDILENLSASLREHGIETRVDAGEDVVAWGFPQEYSQVLLNILSNARDALLANAVAGGIIHVRIIRGGSLAHVIVQDNAGGIPDATLDRLFEPDFATRRKGAGIGLFMSKLIMEDCMNGSIEARNIEDGAEFVVTCPLAKAS